jgi:hypothetical protein
MQCTTGDPSQGIWPNSPAHASVGLCQTFYLWVCRVPVKIMTNMERGEALRMLDEEGTLLVMCSLVENMPYVLAEAAVGPSPSWTHRAVIYSLRRSLKFKCSWTSLPAMR